MTTAVANLWDLLKELPSGAWVAISEEDQKVVAFGADAQDVLNEAKSKGVHDPLITKVPESPSAMLVF